MPAHEFRALTVLLISLLMVVGCGGGATPTSPNVANPDLHTPTPGTYYGTLKSQTGQTYPLAMSLTINGTQVTGSWGNSCAVCGTVDVGTLTGTLTGTSLNATLISSKSGVCFPLTGTLSGSTFYGSYPTVSGCAVLNSTFTLNAVTLPSIEGNASGSLNDSIAGAGTISASVSQNGVALNGTFSDSFGLTGKLYGVIVGSTVYFQLSPTNPGDCPLWATGTLSGGTLIGNYNTAPFNCQVSDSGTFSMTW